MGKIVVSKTRGKTLAAKMALVVLCVMALGAVMYGTGLVSGSAQAASNSSLMHNSANTSTKYGTWGTTKDCSWCHNSRPASRFGNNIKFILQNISTPTGVRPATFTKITASQTTAMGMLGNDERSTLTTSTNICEVCHHKTTFHQYSASKLADRTHNNRSDCTTCHAHSAGFYASCASCHPSTGGLATNLTTNATGGVAGAHDKHTVTRSMACETCHSGYTKNPMGNKQIEMSFAINHTNFSHFTSTQSVAFGTYSGGPLNNGYTWVGKTGTTIASSTNTNASCNVYCHGGWATSGAPERSWKSTMPTCTTGAACHFYNAASAPAGAGSHAKHAVGSTVNLACSVCHPSASYDNGHLNGSVKWALSGTGYTASSKYKNANSGVTTNVAPSSSYSSCSSTNCHGQNSPVWGSTVRPDANQCEKCHGSQSVAYANVSSAEIAPGTGNIDTARNTGVTARGGVHQEHLKASSNYTDKIHCGSCHTVVNNVTDATHLNYTTATVAFKDLAIARGRTAASASRSAGIVQCNNTYCHNVPAKDGSATGGAAQTPAWNNASYLAGSLNDCKQCHGFPPTSAAHPVVSPVPTALPLGSSCNCHDSLSQTATTMATLFVKKNEHMDGIVQGGTCVSCHDKTQGNRAIIVGEFATQSHHVQGRAVTNADCYQCHMEAKDTSGTPDNTYHVGTANSGAAINLVTWANGTNGTRGTTYISYTANGKRSSIKKVNDHCLSCHNSANSAFAPFVAGSTTDRYAPEQRLATPKPKTSILSRYSSTRTVAWSKYLFNNNSGAVSKYGTNQKSRITKALSAHGNAIKNQFPQWDATANGRGDDEVMTDAASATLGANRNVFCYDCHNSHGSIAVGVTSSYSSATGRYKGGLLKTTEAGKRGYSVNYTPAGRDITYRNVSGLGQTAWLSTTNKNIINGTPTYTMNPGASLCNDCHNDDTRKVNIQKPWSITNTYSSSRAIVGYWSTPYFDNYTMYPAKRTTYKLGGTANSGINDRRKPMGGHFGTSVSTRSAGHAGDINGLCTPCHDPHGVSNALGAAGSGTTKAGKDYGVPLLKGTWVTTPYREDKASPLVKRGGGRNFTGITNGGGTPGYHIDQNTFLSTPAPLNGGAAVTTSVSQKRAQRFRSFSNNSSALSGLNMPNLGVATFAGICTECHRQVDLTGSATATTSKPWKTKERIHQSVSGWASTNGTNSVNKVHAYTCAKCHAPHVSRLPRLLVTNCLDARHIGRALAGSINPTTTGTTSPGNILQSTLSSTALGAGRFPGGGSRYSGTPASAQNPGGWWFQTNGAAGTTQPTAASYGSNCHNSATSGGATYNPTNQRWNNKSPW